ncbi:MAG: hypothetical protein PHC92_10695 [Syntrophomonadaceae bacterium]|nr:hypothetical protein [Syntrophomonadaceae bacterium]
MLVLIGEKEIIYPAKKALERLNRVAPQIKTALIPAAGYDLVWTQTNLVNQKILEFFDSQVSEKMGDTRGRHVV